MMIQGERPEMAMVSASGIARRQQRVRAALALAAILAGFAFVSARSMPGFAMAEAESPSQPTPGPGFCGLTLDKQVLPLEVRLGEPVQVTLVLTAACNSVPVPWHIVLVIDASNTDAQTGDEMKDRLVELVQHLDLDNNPQIMVGVVEYKDQATTLCQLTNQASRVQSCIRRISFDGGSRTDLGIEEGLTMLRRGRLPTGPDPREVLVVTLTGTPNNGCGPSQQAAQDAKAEGVLVITLAAGLEADEQCARQIATSPRYAFTLRDWTELLDMFDRILEEHNVTPRPRSATITDTLPLDVEYIAGSAVPPATLSGRDLVWRGLDLPPNTITLTFGLRPLVPGRQPTNVEALARVSFVDHAVITGTFPVPEIVVLPNASPTASPTATEDETPEPTNTSTPTGRAWPIYLPDSRAKGP